MNITMRKKFRKFANTLRNRNAAPVIAKIRALKAEVERIEKLL
jgi:hypothetical protein